MKFLLLLSLLFAGCASPMYVSDKDAWVSAGPIFNRSIYYCERVATKGGLLPVCVEASFVSDWVRLEMLQAKPAAK